MHKFSELSNLGWYNLSRTSTYNLCKDIKQTILMLIGTNTHPSSTCGWTSSEVPVTSVLSASMNYDIIIIPTQIKIVAFNAFAKLVGFN